MLKQSYGRFIKPIVSGELNREKALEGQVVFTRVPGIGAQTVLMSGREHLHDIGLSLTWATHNGIGRWHGGRGLHVHPYPEVQLYVGLDTANINYLGAEVEIHLGEEMENYTFNEPAVVVIPAGVPHGPTVTQRIYSPRGFAFCSLALAPEFTTEWLDKPVSPVTGNKYARLVRPLKSFIVMQRGRPVHTKLPSRMAGLKPGPGTADHLARMCGHDLEGLNVDIGWGFFSRPGLWHRGAGAHVHAADEIMMFAGTDPADMDCLGAEIELDMGGEHERHLVARSSVVVFPAGTPHGPLVTRWVDRPFAVFSAILSAAPEMKFVD